MSTAQHSTAQHEIALENCRFVKTILMLIIILYHSMLFWNNNWFDICEPVYKSTIIPIITQWLNSFQVYAFTLVSGYIFYALKYEKDKYNNFTNFVRKKIRRLIVPFIFVSIFWAIPVDVYFWGYNPNIINKYLFATGPSQLWFLWMLFDIFIFCWATKRWLKNNILAMFISIITFVVGSAATKYINNYYCLCSALQYILFFILGMKIREYREQLINFNIPIFKLFCLNILLFTLFMTMKNVYLTIPTNIVIRIIVCIVKLFLNIEGAFTAFYGLQKLSSNQHLKDNKFLLMLSKYSFPIYLLHQQFIYFSNIYFNGLFIPIWHIVVNFVIALVGSMFIIAVAKNWNLTKNFIGI